VRARTDGLTVGDVDRAMTEDRTLLITWLNRGTLHLVRSEDYPWLQALTTAPLFTANATRLRQEGVDADEAERAVGVIERELADRGPMTRLELRDHLDAAGIRTAGQAFIHLAMLACLRGIAVRGPMVGKQHAYVLVRDWIGEPKPVDRGRALTELARRYLIGHAPASDRDLAKWAGLPLREARAGLAAIGSELEDAGDGAVRLRGRSPASGRMPRPRLLGAFDPTLLGWSSREQIVGGHGSRIVSGGVFRPYALVAGRAAATWKWAEGEVLLEPLGEISARAGRSLEREAADIARFLSA
jgi:DNA glycosylase AlkZ-like